MKDQGSDALQLENLEVVPGRTIFFDGASTFSAMQVSFTKVLERNPDSFWESFYLFAGQPVHIRIVGRALAEKITHPFSHLQTTGPALITPQLTIDLWDENETGIRCQTALPNQDSRWTDVTAVSSDHRFIGHRQPNTFACLDRTTNHIIGSIGWNEPIGVYERAKPLSRLLVEWHNDQKIQVIHAGLIARNGRGVLFAGKSGSGKSTSSLACLCAGFHYLSEDFVGLRQSSDGSFQGYSLYNSVFLEIGHLTRFPHLLPYVIKGRPTEEKSAVILSHVFPERIERVVPIQALLIPCVVDARESKISPASKGQALLALGPSSLFQIPSRRMRGFEKLAQLIERLPCYWLEAGCDLDSIPRCVEELTAEATRL